MALCKCIVGLGAHAAVKSASTSNVHATDFIECYETSLLDKTSKNLLCPWLADTDLVAGSAKVCPHTDSGFDYAAYYGEL